MRIDRFTNQLQTVLSDAQSLAVGRDNNVIDPLHILAAMLDQPGGSIAPLLAQAGADVQSIRPQVQQALDALPTVQGAGGDVHMSNDMSRVLNIADKISQQNKDAYISSEVVALALLEVNTAAKKVLSDAGVTKQSLESAIANVRGGETVDDPAAEESRQALEKYTIDLTARAEEGKLDPVIGRDDEIRRTVQVLQRRTKK